MPYFKYKAKNEHAENVKGKVEARNKSQAAALLRSRNLLVISLEAEGTSVLTQLNAAVVGVRKDDVVGLTRQLSTMITAGLSLTDALHILEQQSKPAMSKLLRELLREIEGGSTFAAALEQHPKVFTRVFAQLVRAGETAGVLDQVLDRLAETMEKDKEFRGKTRGAMIYPIIVLVAMVIVAGVMIIFVVPKLTAMYEDFGASLPFLTQVLLDFSDAVRRSWWVGVLLIAGVTVGMRTWGRTPAGKRYIGRLMLRIPLFGDLRRKIILTEYTRTMSMLLSAGISLLQALEIVAEASPSILYRESMHESARKVEKGVSLAQAIHDTTLFPPILIQMTAVGEETGKLDEVLGKLSAYFQSESEQSVKNLTTAMEPIIMIVLGIGVGLMVVAIILPIYSLTSQF